MQTKNPLLLLIHLKYCRLNLFVILLSLVSVSISIIGCDITQSSFFNKEKTFGKTNLSVDELQVQLDTFEEVFTSRTKAAAAEIDRLSEDPKTRKMTLLWRSRAIAALHNVREQPQPMLVLVDSWLLCIRLSNFIESGEAGNAFGDYQSIATTTVKDLEAQIEEVARQVLPEELFDQTASELKKMALGNPIGTGFGKTLTYSKQAKMDQPGIFQSIISIPLSPVRALEGVDRTPTAIYDFSNTTQRMTDVVQELPESTRWQLLLLLYDLEETKMANSFLKSLQNISESSSKLSETAEQVVTMLTNTDQNQEQIRQTLREINETTANLQNLFNTAQQTAAVFSETAHEVNTAASNWAQAAQATKDVLVQVQSKVARDSTDPAEKMNLKETAEAVGLAAAEIKLASEELPDKAEQIVMQASSLITQITLNIALLVLLIFCLYLTCIFIKKKIQSAKK